MKKTYYVTSWADDEGSELLETENYQEAKDKFDYEVDYEKHAINYPENRRSHPDWRVEIGYNIYDDDDNLIDFETMNITGIYPTSWSED